MPLSSAPILVVCADPLTAKELQAEIEAADAMCSWPQASLSWSNA